MNRRICCFILLPALTAALFSLPGCTVKRVTTLEKKTAASAVTATLPPSATTTFTKETTQDQVLPDGTRIRRARGRRHEQRGSKIGIFEAGKQIGVIDPDKLSGLQEIRIRAYRSFRGFSLYESLRQAGIVKAREILVEGTGEKTGKPSQLLKWSDVKNPENGIILGSQSNGMFKLVGSKMISERFEQVQDIVRITVTR